MTTIQSTITLGQQLLNAARSTPIKLTDHYWGSVLDYTDGKYTVRHFKQAFGGMRCNREVRILARDISNLDTIEDLERVLAPTCDLAPGDPMHYTPRDVRRVELTWSADE